MIHQLIKKDIDKDVLNIFQKSNFILGEEVVELEEKLAEYVGVSECVTCASGTDALLIPLMAYGFKSGDAIFTTNFSYSHNDNFLYFPPRIQSSVHEPWVNRWTNVPFNKD